MSSNEMNLMTAMLRDGTCKMMSYPPLLQREMEETPHTALSEDVKKRQQVGKGPGSF